LATAKRKLATAKRKLATAKRKLATEKRKLATEKFKTPFSTVKMAYFGVIFLTHTLQTHLALQHQGKYF